MGRAAYSHLLAFHVFGNSKVLVGEIGCCLVLTGLALYASCRYVFIAHVHTYMATPFGFCPSHRALFAYFELSELSEGGWRGSRAFEFFFALGGLVLSVRLAE